MAVDKELVGLLLSLQVEGLLYPVGKVPIEVDKDLVYDFVCSVQRHEDNGVLAGNDVVKGVTIEQHMSA